MTNKKIIMGIDLGTTNSLVSYWEEGKAHLVANPLGKNLTPSIISIDGKGGILVGEVAKERQISHPDLSASLFKRYMGTKKEYFLGEKKFLPEELAALVIKALKEDVEHQLGVSVNEAIISVPAYFSDVQRRATKRAGELAGLKVERLVTEPTAAAIAYGTYLENKDAKILVFDLGGGTFDISILELFENVMEVRAVAGDNYLGGEDFTQLLVEGFLDHHNIDINDLDKKNQLLLRKQAEIAKRQFSEEEAFTIDCNIEGRELPYDITLEEYGEMAKHLFQRLREPIERALRDASLKVRDIDSILMVGGATRLPLIRSFVGKLFGRLPFANINPDEVVGIGAGIQGALKGRDAAIKEVILTDVCPYTLGTAVSVRRKQGYFEPGHFLPIIERNTTIPISRVERLYTVSENQKQIHIEILQGESRLVKDNIFLGEINIPVPPGPPGQEAVDVRFSYDLNGILEVEAVVVSTGIKKNIVIEKDPGALTEKEIAESIEKLWELKIHPRENVKNKLVIAWGERLYEEKTGIVRREIADLLRDFEDVLDEQIPSKIEEKRRILEERFDAIDHKGGF